VDPPVSPASPAGLHGPEGHEGADGSGAAPLDTCVTCGTQLAGRYCHQCGEKRREERDLTLAAFLHYAVEALTNADAKLYRTMRLLLTRPGALTRDFIAGRRQPYVAPLQLFLLVNVLYFMALQTPIRTNAFTTDLAFHRLQPMYGGMAGTLLEGRLGPLPSRERTEPMSSWLSRWTPEQREFRERFNDASPRYANSLVIVMVPLFAAGLRLLRRRSLLVRELVLSFHFFTVVLLTLTAVPATALLLRTAGLPGGHFLASEEAAAWILGSTFFAYLFLAFRRAHGDATFPALLRAAAALAILLLVVTLYRATLFFVVFRSM
jgi:hypothetical protein